MLQEVGLNLNFLSVIVTDTEPTMNSMGRMLEGRDNVPWIGCLDHLINLVTSIAFDYPSTKDTMISARKLVGTFTGSTQNSDKLKEAQQILRHGQVALVPIQDVITRWWSTYRSIERLLTLRPSIEYLTQAAPPIGYTLSTDEWDTLLVVKSVLEPFRNVQLYLEGANYQTLGFVAYGINDLRYGLDISITNILAIASPTETEAAILRLLSAMKAKFIEKFGPGKRAGSKLLENYCEYRRPGVRNSHVGIPKITMMASFLDPRFKHLKIFDSADRLLIIADVHAEMELQYNRDAAAISDIEAPPVQRRRVEYAENTLFFRIAEMQNETDPVDFELQDCIQRELEAYINEQCVPMEVAISETQKRYTDPLEWWRCHSNFKLLSLVAKRILCIPATSASSERVFSDAGNVISEERSRLAPDVASSLILLKHWDKIENLLGLPI